MSVFLIIFCIICFVGVKFAGPGEFNRDYMSKDTTVPVKGIFVLLVFFKHFLGECPLNGDFDGFALWYRTYIGQTVVTLFLFYSGYGVMESIKKRGRDYVSKLPIRVLRLWLHFALAVLLYLIFRLATGKRYGIVRIIKAFTGIQSIGNSTWYIIAMLIMYLLTFAAFIAFQFSKRKFLYLPATILTLFVIAYIIITHGFGISTLWYSTIICYPMGIWYSLLKERIEKILFKGDFLWWLALLISIISFCYSYAMRESAEGYLICMAIFLVTAVLVTMKVRFDNAFLVFFGNHVFSVYMLQKLSFMFLRHLKLFKSYSSCCFVISLAATVVMSLAFDYVTEKIDKRLFLKESLQKTL